MFGDVLIWKYHRKNIYALSGNYRLLSGIEEITRNLGGLLKQ